MAAVTVSPFNVHSLTGALLHFHRFGIRGSKGQNAAFLCLDPGHLLGGSGLDRFVGHTKQYDIGAPMSGYVRTLRRLNSILMPRAVDQRLYHGS